MTDSDYTLIALLVDRSGSMAAIRAAAEDAVNEFVAGQAAAPGRAGLYLSQFDDRYEAVHVAVPVDRVPRYVLEPRGMTALLDSLGRLTTDVGRDLADLPEDQRPGKVLVVVQTDGQENASKEWTAASIKATLDHQRQVYGWDFVFLGANMDAIAAGATMGFDAASSIQYAATPGGVGSAIGAANAYVTRARAGRAAAFTDEERRAAGGQG